MPSTPRLSPPPEETLIHWSAASNATQAPAKKLQVPKGFFVITPTSVTTELLISEATYVVLDTCAARSLRKGDSPAAAMLRQELIKNELTIDSLMAISEGLLHSNCKNGFETFYVKDYGDAGAFCSYPDTKDLRVKALPLAEKLALDVTEVTLWPIYAALLVALNLRLSNPRTPGQDLAVPYFKKLYEKQVPPSIGTTVGLLVLIGSILVTTLLKLDKAHESDAELLRDIRGGAYDLAAFQRIVMVECVNKNSQGYLITKDTALAQLARQFQIQHSPLDRSATYGHPIARWFPSTVQDEVITLHKRHVPVFSEDSTLAEKLFVHRCKTVIAEEELQFHRQNFRGRYPAGSVGKLVAESFQAASRYALRHLPMAALTKIS